MDLREIKLPAKLKKTYHSVKYVLDNSNYSSLVEAVLQQMGFSDSEDYYSISTCNRAGANAGISGFIYHRECDLFVSENSVKIAEYIRNFCEETGSMGEEYQEKAMDMLIEESDLTNEEEVDDYLQNINLSIAGMCYGFFVWSPYFRNLDNDVNDLTALYEFFRNETLNTETNIGTFLAWFALEGVCREFEKND